MTASKTISASNPSAPQLTARLERAAVYTSALAFPAMALSISGTQILVAFSFVFFAAAFVAQKFSQQRRSDARNIIKFSIVRSLPPAWLAGAAMFAWLVFSGAWHVAFDLYTSGEWATAMTAAGRAVTNEWSDLPLFLFGLLVFHQCRSDVADHRKILGRGFAALVVLLVVSGLAATLFEFRLARLVPHVIKHLFSDQELLMTASAANRPQHPFGVYANLQLYRPIGFMNTRLTFAGLLMLAVPFAAVRAFFPDQPGVRTKLAKRAFWTAISVAGGALFFLNGTRSILLGAAVTALIGGVLWLRAFRWPPLRIVGATIVAIAVAGGIYAASGDVRVQVRRQLADLERHTDYARPVLWTVAGALVREHPVLGVGPGNFERAGLAWRAAYAAQHHETWYFFQNTPRGHAHNDLLHLAAIGGIPAALCFLALIFFTVREIFENPSEPYDRRLVLLGALGFFVAGVAQCYFQDDEVTTLFWAMLGLATGHARPPGDSNESDQRSEN